MAFFAAGTLLSRSSVSKSNQIFYNPLEQNNWLEQKNTSSASNWVIIRSKDDFERVKYFHKWKLNPFHIRQPLQIVHCLFEAERFFEADLYVETC